MTTTFRDARKIISEAITALEKAEDNASGSQQIVLLDLLEILRGERMKIDVQNLAGSDDTYVALTKDIKDAGRKLDELGDEIKAIIEEAEQVAQVVGALARLVRFAAGIAA